MMGLAIPPRHFRPHVVVLGGGYAGLAAATRIGRIANVWVTVVDARAEFVERIRLHQAATGQTLRHFPYRDFLEQRGIRFVQAELETLNPDSGTLSIRVPCGDALTINYDYLVYALGSRQNTDAVEGVREHALTLDSLEAAKAMHEVLLQQKSSSEVLVVGGGLTGIETATEVAESFPHLRVKLVIDQPFEAQTRPGGYSPGAVAYLQRSLAQRGVSVQTGCRINRVQEGTAETTSNGRIAFDACIWTGGFTPVPYAAAAGIQVNQIGQIVTDASLRSLSHPNIIAIGDAAQAETSTGGTCRMGCATALAMASSSAQTVAALLAGREPPAFRFVYLFRNISLGRHDGLIQFVDANDVPRNLVWTGPLAVRWKEYICNGTLATVGFQPQAKMPAFPPLRMLPQLLRGASQYA